MDIRIKYTYEEVKEIVAAEHLRRFGTAPDGEEWSVSGDYGMFKVENIKKEADEDGEV